MPDYTVDTNFNNGYYSVTDPDGETILIKTGKTDYAAGDIITGELGNPNGACQVQGLSDIAESQNVNQFSTDGFQVTTGQAWAEDYWSRIETELQEENAALFPDTNP